MWFSFLVWKFHWLLVLELELSLRKKGTPLGQDFHRVNRHSDYQFCDPGLLFDVCFLTLISKFVHFVVLYAICSDLIVTNGNFFERSLQIPRAPRAMCKAQGARRRVAAA
jgi:hypothetical protein